MNEIIPRLFNEHGLVASFASLVMFALSLLLVWQMRSML